MANTVLYTPSADRTACVFLFNANGFIASHKLGIAQTIGSDKKKSDIFIESSLVRPLHGEIFFANGKYHYKDTESCNGTFLNRTLLGVNSPGNVLSATLSDGDILLFDAPKDGKPHREWVLALFSTSISEHTQWCS